MEFEGVTVPGYLRETGVPLRTEPITQQLSPKGRLATVQLVDRTLYDLLPGKLYAVTTDTLEDYGVYSSERDL